MVHILASMSGFLEGCLMISVTVVVVGFEMRRCSQGVAIQRTLKKYTPEAIGLTVLVLIAGLLRIKGGTGQLPLNEEAEESWNEIVRQWPWLMTADTLLGFQSMLRFLLFNSALLRLGGEGCPSGIAKETAALFLTAMLIRLGLFWYSLGYHLDGPIGGDIAGGFEAATVFPLFALVFSTGTWNFKNIALIVVAIAACSLAASFHHFQLAEEIYANEAFIFIHCLETCAAVAHLFHAGSVAVASSGGIVALGLPVQQVLSAYYFFEAFEAVLGLVGAGRPFELMWATGVLQLGIFLLAGAVYLACLMEGIVAKTSEAVPSTATPSANVSKLSALVF